MAPHSRSSKSSIKSCQVPLEVRTFESYNVCLKENAEESSSRSLKSESISPSKIISTANLASALANAWDIIAQPVVTPPKENVSCDSLFWTKNIIGHSNKSDARSITDSAYAGFVLSAPLKSEFENLKSLKKRLLYSRRANSSIISNQMQGFDSAPHEDSSRICKMAGVGICNEFKTILHSIICKSFSGLEYLSKHEFSILLQACSSRRPLSCSNRTATTEGKHLLDESEELHKPLPSATSHEAATCTEDKIPVLTENPFVQLDCKNELSTSGQSQESLDLVSSADKFSLELSASCDNSTHELTIVQENLIEEHYCKQWPVVRDKLHDAFTKSRCAAAGALAGTFVSVCLHPIDTVKTMMQSNAMGKLSYYQVLRGILLSRGFMGLYRGISSNIASSAPISALYTFTYESVKGTLLPLLPQEYYSLAHCVGGGCSSIATSFIFTPSERIKQQLQVGLQYHNCWNALVRIIEKGGIASLYTGWCAVLCRNIPHSIIKFFAYEKLKMIMLSSAEPSDCLNTFQTLLCGGLAGSTAALFTTPFDVVKTRLQTQVPGSLGKYNGVLHALQDIAMSEGLRGLYRGLTPRLAMYVSQGAIFFASYEFIKAAFSMDVLQECSVTEDNLKEEDSDSPSKQKVHL